jgi:hypothetical protein
MSIEPFLQGRAYDPELTRIMGLAFDNALNGLHDSGQPAVVQEIIAKRIVDLAATGERDPVRLAAKALEALGIQRI